MRLNKQYILLCDINWKTKQYFFRGIYIMKWKHNKLDHKTLIDFGTLK